jgi:polar amino acid transport system substrate-binding protein
VAVGELFDSAPYGWAVQKGSKLGDALAAAFDSIVADGTYKSICDTWGVTEGLLEKAGRNASVS